MTFFLFLWSMRSVGEWSEINDFTLDLFTEALDSIGFPGITADWILVESMGMEAIEYGR